MGVSVGSSCKCVYKRGEMSVEHTRGWTGSFPPAPSPKHLAGPEAHFFPSRNLCSGPPPAISITSMRSSAWQTPMSRTM